MPQVAGVLAPRPLVITRPIGARLQEIDPTAASDLLHWTIAAYQRRGAPAPIVLGSISVQTLAEMVMGVGLEE